MLFGRCFGIHPISQCISLEWFSAFRVWIIKSSQPNKIIAISSDGCGVVFLSLTLIKALGGLLKERVLRAPLPFAASCLAWGASKNAIRIVPTVLRGLIAPGDQLIAALPPTPGHVPVLPLHRVLVGPR